MRVISQDLGYGGCRLVVAVPESWIDVTHALDLVELAVEFKESGKTFRVSTKYPNLTQEFFRRKGIHHYQVIDSDGALELHPSLGIADIIVDLTSSGTTLKDNRLREIDGGTVLDSASCLIGHGPALWAMVDEGESGPLAPAARRHRRRPRQRGVAPSRSCRSSRAEPKDGRGRGRLSDGAGGPAHRPRRGLGRLRP